MIRRITGRLADLTDGVAVIEVGGFAYEVLVPACAQGELAQRRGVETSLETIQYIEGNPNMGNLVPRLIGFGSAEDREFFLEFVKVKNVGPRKALRAMVVPARTLAAAIESGDERALAELPEIGKRTAAQIVAQLRGRLQRFAAGGPPSAAAAQKLTDAQLVALDVLTKWGDRPADAERWLRRAAELHPELSKPDEWVRAAYRVKQGG